MLGLYGSPRRRGNTDLLLDEFLRGCEEAGAEVERLILARLQISGCRGCEACSETGKCVVEDDMQRVYQAIERSTHVAVASPIYFYSVTAQTKIVLDRTQALWSRKYLLKAGSGDPSSPPAKKGMFLSVGATKGKHLFTGALYTMRYFFDAVDAEHTGDLLYAGVDEKGAIREHPSAMRESYEAGLRFVRNRSTRRRAKEA